MGATEFRKKLFNKNADRSDADKNGMATTNAVQSGGGGDNKTTAKKEGDRYVDMGVLETAPRR